MVLQVHLHPNCRARKKTFLFDFSTLEVRGKEAKGRIVTRFPIQRIAAHRGRTESWGTHVPSVPSAGADKADEDTPDAVASGKTEE